MDCDFCRGISPDRLNRGLSYPIESGSIPVVNAHPLMNIILNDDVCIDGYIIHIANTQYHTMYSVLVCSK